ncbi:hypothetical protein Slin15195_G049710 [Septoria linicola]|uniref:Uncharacterized protein n=1 Tax=Septoria linicola TaxID=215465 RepID=A0A9Q9ALI7_9PEZI|nr:hypothetical protein Slin14017_G053240 [Septoria linicola]USW51652.1 hypothetical protein Slin15195_G049710 [Septoria linicola]
MPSYDFKIAKESLTESEKDRILAIYLNTVNENANINWEKAAADYGSASVDSMKVSLRNSFKKLEKAGAKIEDDGYVVPYTPAKTPKGAKRKAATEGEEGAEPKKKGRPSKKAKAAAVKEEEDLKESDDAEEKVKGEEE